MPTQRISEARTAPHFVLQSLPRSGSIMLGRILDQHPELRCFGEIFSTKPVHIGPHGFATGAPRDTAAAPRLLWRPSVSVPVGFSRACVSWHAGI